MIKFQCINCGQKIRVLEVHAGKKGKCPKCKTVVVVPEINDDVSLGPQDSDGYNLQSVQQPVAGWPNVSNESVLKPESKERPPERKLPWVIDIFLYPMSMSGLINLGIFWILPPAE